MQSQDGLAARLVIDSDHIESAGFFLHVPLGQELHGGFGKHFLFFRRYAKFRQGGQFFADGLFCVDVRQRSRSYFDEDKCFAVVTDQVDFSFRSTRHVITGDEHVTEVP